MARPPLESMDLRSRRLLQALIARYIQDGQPVGSRTLAKHAGIDLSPATIRNVLADLEDSGLVHAPHTSAGRIPTVQGYRVFVDSLLQVSPLQDRELERMRSELAQPGSTTDLANSVSGLLSSATRFVGLVSVPKRDGFALKQIDFVQLGPRRILAVLVFADGEVQNRVIDGARVYTASELEQIANYLTAQCQGLLFSEIRRQLLSDLRLTRQSIDQMMATAMDLAEAALGGDQEPDDLVVAGQTNLMGVQDLGDMDKLRELFETFYRKQDMLRLLERCIHADGMRIFIGEESGHDALGQCSLITAPYGRGGKVLGVLGVIGPTRMAYERVIPVVEATAQLLSEVLNQQE